MNNFIYKDIVDEFDSYMDNNYPETIYLDTVKLYTERDKDIYSLYEEIIGERERYFDDILNRIENTVFCNYITKNNKKRIFYEISYNLLDKCDDNNDLYCKLNTLQVIGSNTKLNNNVLINEINKKLDSYPNTIKLSLKNVNMLFSNNPYEKLIEFVEFIKKDEKNERFYSSFIEFYYTDFKFVIEAAINSIKHSQVNYIAIFIPIIYQAVKNALIPSGTKTVLSELIACIKKIKSALPSELNNKYQIIDQILEINPDDFKKAHLTVSKKKKEPNKCIKPDN